MCWIRWLAFNISRKRKLWRVWTDFRCVFCLPFFRWFIYVRALLSIDFVMILFCVHINYIVKLNASTKRYRLWTSKQKPWFCPHCNNVIIIFVLYHFDLFETNIKKSYSPMVYNYYFCNWQIIASLIKFFFRIKLIIINLLYFITDYVQTLMRLSITK